MEQTQSNRDKYLDTGQLLVPGIRVFESELESHQVELVYTQAPAAVGAAFVVAVLLTLGLWSQVDHTMLLLWLGAQTLQTVARLWLVYQYRRASPEQKKHARWSILFLTGTLLSGIVWGCIGLFFQFSWPV
ncbi:MAG: hypothetical protein KAJ73_08865, partial [Zetaproteobacteria bacterium]|nr:hypothetical protein [Zetaproteobacteria bacterium]